MPRTANTLAAGVRISDKLTLAQMQRYFPVAVIKASLKSSERESKRIRELPNELIAYYPMLLCLYREVSQQEVLRVLGDGLQWIDGLKEFKITGRSGISQARSRVGSEPLRLTFEKCAVPLARDGAEGCFYAGMRLVAMDGTDLDLEDGDEIAAYFGRSSNQHGEGAYPKARVVGLVEIGTRAAFGLSIGTFRESENALATSVIPKLDVGMLCLADQLFMSFEIFQQCRDTGAELLFRAREDRVLPKEKRLADGSYLSTIFDSADRRRLKGIRVRVIEYVTKVSCGDRQTTHRYRLITTLLDAKKHPATTLSQLYRERWEVETMLDEVKTHLMRSQPVRSRTPALVLQEIYGMMMAHYTIKAVMYEAAESARIDPDQLSFTHSKNVLERNLPKIGVFPPSETFPTHRQRNTVGQGLV